MSKIIVLTDREYGVGYTLEEAKSLLDGWVWDYDRYGQLRSEEEVRGIMLAVSAVIGDVLGSNNTPQT